MIAMWRLSAALSCVFVGPFGWAASRPSVTWQPQKLVNGSPVLFQVIARPNARAISGKWLDHDLVFFHGTTAGSWYVLAGVPLEAAPGSHELKINETFANGSELSVVKKIRVGKGAYPTVKVKVNVAKQFTEPSAEQLKEVAEDKEEKQKVFAAITAERLWAGPFLPPASAATSDPFGTARVFNGEVRSKHQGLDYAVPAGTPIHAVNRGTVILARPMFFEGNCIVIDHGQGLLSLYLHLSEFLVKEGDRVESGQILGQSGGSGRATGPHLHLAIRWQGVYLNPATLLKMKLPAE
jgi:murein DD-endopeptidase MepM/ murein hydrolase activator NlpD